MTEVSMPLPQVRTWDGEQKPFNPVGSQGPACAASAFPPEDGQEALDYQAQYCVRCPVLMQCAPHGMNHEPWGTYGLTEDQRANLGGVVDEAWSARPINPYQALAELDEVGMPLETVEAIVSTAPTHNRAVAAALKAVRERIAERNAARERGQAA